jgi:hypothetical protein
MHHHVLNTQHLGFGQVIGQAKQALLPQISLGGQVYQVRGVNDGRQAPEVFSSGSKALYFAGPQAAGFPTAGAFGKNLNSTEAQQARFLGSTGNAKLARDGYMKTVFQ